MSFTFPSLYVFSVDLHVQVASLCYLWTTSCWAAAHTLRVKGGWAKRKLLKGLEERVGGCKTVTAVDNQWIKKKKRKKECDARSGKRTRKQLGEVELENREAGALMSNCSALVFCLRRGYAMLRYRDEKRAFWMHLLGQGLLGVRQKQGACIHRADQSGAATWPVTAQRDRLKKWRNQACSGAKVQLKSISPPDTDLYGINHGVFYTKQHQIGSHFAPTFESKTHNPCFFAKFYLFVINLLAEYHSYDSFQCAFSFLLEIQARKVTFHMTKYQE